MTHPDGRLQRLRPGVPHPGQVRPTWQALVELSSLLGEETGLDSAPEVLAAIASEVPFYGGLSHGVIGGKGARWQERDAAGAHPASSGGDSPPATSAGDGPEARSSEAGIRLGTYRDLWAAEVAERSPALRFLVPEQTLELAPADAQRLELRPGDRVEVATNGTSVTARVALRERMRPGAGFLIEGLGGANANLLDPREPVTLRRLEEGG